MPHLPINRLEGMAQDIRKALEVSKTELKEINEKKLLLEKECVIYKNQLQVHHIHVCSDIVHVLGTSQSTGS